jgi:hypothetical protein
MKDINSFSTPINKTAALVTNCKTTLDDDISRLKEQSASAHSAIVRFHRLAKNERDKEMKAYYLAEALRVQEMQTQIKNRIREVKRSLNDTGNYIIAICRGRFSDDEWGVIVHKARQLKANEVDGGPVDMREISENERQSVKRGSKKCQ